MRTLELFFQRILILISQFLCYRDQLKLLKNHQEELNQICLDFLELNLNLLVWKLIKSSEKLSLACAGSILFWLNVKSLSHLDGMLFTHSMIQTTKFVKILLHNILAEEVMMANLQLPMIRKKKFPGKQYNIYLLMLTTVGVLLMIEIVVWLKYMQWKYLMTI